MCSNEQQFAEQALSVVMAKWGKEAIAERNVLQKRLDELKEIYPVHFLTDADINNGETGVFQIHKVVEGRNHDIIYYERIVFMGKTADGKFKWRPTDPFPDDWGSGKDYDGMIIPKYDQDEEGNRLVKEEQMNDWAARLDPCREGFCDSECRVCGCGSVIGSDYGSESEEVES